MTTVTTSISHPGGKTAIDALNDPVAASRIFNFFSHLGLRFKFSQAKQIISRTMTYNTDGSVMISTVEFATPEDAVAYTGHPIITTMVADLQKAGYTVEIAQQD